MNRERVIKRFIKKMNKDKWLCRELYYAAKGYTRQRNVLKGLHEKLFGE